MDYEFVVHEYFGIDYENIWKIILDDLPKNIQDLEKEDIEAALKYARVV